MESFKLYPTRDTDMYQLIKESFLRQDITAFFLTNTKYIKDLTEKKEKTYEKFILKGEVAFQESVKDIIRAQHKSIQMCITDAYNNTKITDLIVRLEVCQNNVHRVISTKNSVYLAFIYLVLPNHEDFGIPIRTLRDDNGKLTIAIDSNAMFHMRAKSSDVVDFIERHKDGIDSKIPGTELDLMDIVTFTFTCLLTSHSKKYWKSKKINNSFIEYTPACDDIILNSVRRSMLEEMNDIFDKSRTVAITTNNRAKECITALSEAGLLEHASIIDITFLQPPQQSNTKEVVEEKKEVVQPDESKSDLDNFFDLLKNN